MRNSHGSASPPLDHCVGCISVTSTNLFVVAGGVPRATKSTDGQRDPHITKCGRTEAAAKMDTTNAVAAQAAKQVKQNFVQGTAAPSAVAASSVVASEEACGDAFAPLLAPRGAEAPDVTADLDEEDQLCGTVVGDGGMQVYLRVLHERTGLVPLTPLPLSSPCLCC